MATGLEGSNQDPWISFNASCGYPAWQQSVRTGLGDHHGTMVIPGETWEKKGPETKEKHGKASNQFKSGNFGGIKDDKTCFSLTSLFRPGPSPSAASRRDSVVPSGAAALLATAG